MATMNKQITIATNYNNKLSNDAFIHIDLAPSTGIPESVAAATILEIKTKDNSHPPVKCKLVDLCRFPLYQVVNLATWSSHGILASEFIEWFMEKYKSTHITTPLAIYYYQKIKDEN